MGLLTRLLTLPVSGPLWVMEKVVEEAERIYYDEGAIRAQLADLEAAFEEGRLTEEELDEAEDVLLERLREARLRRGLQHGSWTFGEPHADEER
jgi:hypothetical protein